MEKHLFTGLGAVYLGDNRCRFQVWAPLAASLEVHLRSPQERLVPMERRARGYYLAELDGVPPGSLYFYRIDGSKDRPDPASRCQPQGVHGPSQVIDSSFAWEDCAWSGLSRPNYLIYELHVGTFTPEGTFAAIIPHLSRLRELGVTALELMPVAQFPGTRNWGYDGVYPFAVQDSYGGPAGLKTLVNACHLQGLAVILDVVYNHLGPEGNYLWDYGPYFSEKYRTPWGAAVNFDGPGSDEVRRFFIANALYWVTEFHLDALRLDALHAVFDQSARTFLQDLAAAVHDRAERLNRRIYLMGESDLNDPRLAHAPEIGGFGLDVLWNDDFHHALHALLTGEKAGYYQDFGAVSQLAKAFREGYVYSGEYSRFRRRRHGASSRLIPAPGLLVFAQNHDQVGNRAFGDRLSRLVSFEALKLAAGVVLLSPFIPLLFMGEEYGETAPFQFFTSFADRDLIDAVREGRRLEHGLAGCELQLPDPQEEATFLACRLQHHLVREERHRVLFDFYRELIRLRREIPALSHLSKEHLEVGTQEPEKILVLRRWQEGSEAAAVFHFGGTEIDSSLALPPGQWHKRLDSAEGRWLGPGSTIPESLRSEGQIKLKLTPQAFALFTLAREE